MLPYHYDYIDLSDQLKMYDKIKYNSAEYIYYLLNTRDINCFKEIIADKNFDSLTYDINVNSNGNFIVCNDNNKFKSNRETNIKINKKLKKIINIKLHHNEEINFVKYINTCPNICISHGLFSNKMQPEFSNILTRADIFAGPRKIMPKIKYMPDSLKIINVNKCDYFETIITQYLNNASNKLKVIQIYCRSTLKFSKLPKNVIFVQKVNDPRKSRTNIITNVSKLNKTKTLDNFYSKYFTTKHYPTDIFLIK